MKGPGTSWWRKAPRRLSIVVDTPGWFDPFAHSLAERLQSLGDTVVLVRDQADVPDGEVAFFLSCTRLTPPEILARNRLNVVVHASDLPQDRGFSPLVWNILRGENTCVVSMIEMAAEADAGDILLQSRLDFAGHELNDELRQALGDEICDLCVRLMAAPAAPEGRAQQGTPSWVPRRRPEDSRLDPAQSIARQFDLMRVVDNERYPAFFDFRGHRYTLKISKLGPTKGETVPASKDKDDA